MPLLTLPSSAAAHRAKALVFEDPLSRALLLALDDLGPSDVTVFITGETGTGKEIVARYLHERSARRTGPFVAVNCGAISASLVEAELFGHERGAFTGATETRPGWFEVARGGTLFLDELGELPPAAQVKLLRVLQEREVVRVGARQPIAVDVRLIVATNTNLAAAVGEGRFRADLYYRVNVAPVLLPPLRERPDDILPLARHFVALFAERLHDAPPAITPAAAARLRAHRWPGNIRELENVVQRAVVAADSVIGTEQLQFDDAIFVASTPASPIAPNPVDALDAALLALFEQAPPDLYARIEAAVIRNAYRFCAGNQLQTARLLGISRNIVRARLIECGELAGPLRPGEALSASQASPRTDR